MKMGTKSILFGVHHWLWHPVTVLLAWRSLYGWPNWKEFVCIVIHDWGYWGCESMDGEEGRKHVEFAANFAAKYLGNGYYRLCLFHSRHYARDWDVEPSKLCWADKLSLMYDPWWFYIPRALLSGELVEYRELGTGIPLERSHREWFKIIRNRCWMLAIQKKADAVPYQEKVK